jgi:hypothetical protein
MCVSAPVSEQLAELQLTLGQGPGHDVLTSATPPLAGDIDDEEPGRQWPAFTAEAGKLGARAVFAFRWPSAYVTKPTGFGLFIDAIRTVDNFYSPRPAAPLGPGADPRVVWARPRGK